jgi:hypothetical protein
MLLNFDSNFYDKVIVSPTGKPFIFHSQRWKLKRFFNDKIIMNDHSVEIRLLKNESPTSFLIKFCIVNGK